MPLQIRRGTDAERLAMTQPLAQGELLFVSTPGAERLYIGNGSTLGGIQITGYTNADAKDAAAAAFTGGTHSGITFTYNTVTDLINANVDLSNYQGTLRADAFKGSVFADDSTLLVDAVSGIIPAAVVSGTFTGNVVGNTTGYHTGDVKGSVFADDSTLLVDAVSGTIVGPVVGNVTGNLTGNVTGDVTGNIFTNLIDSATSSAITFTPAVVFNSDVTVDNELFANLVGNVSGNVSGNVIGNIQGSVLNSSGSAIIDIGNSTFNGASVNIDANGTISSTGTVFTDIPFLLFTAVEPTALIANTSILVSNNSGAHTGAFGLTRVRGSIASPTTVLNGDELGQIVSAGHDGTGFVPSATICYVVDGAVSTGVIPSRIELSTSNASGTIAVRANIKSTVAEFNVPPRLPVVADDTARTALVPTPAAGMMIFMQSGTSPMATNVAQVYDGFNWANLH